MSDLVKVFLHDPMELVTLALFLLMPRRYERDSVVRKSLRKDFTESQSNLIEMKLRTRLFPAKNLDLDKKNQCCDDEDEWKSPPYVKANVVEKVKGSGKRKRHYQTHEDTRYKPRSTPKAKVIKKSDKATVPLQRVPSLESLLTLAESRPMTPVDETYTKTALPTKYVPFSRYIKLVDSWDKVELVDCFEPFLYNIEEDRFYRQTMV
ncbi:unnamed protein product [Bursaphelenchus okinawaensis]|uniref:Uncharacterized protein n=1 Tax=Bursaphelenchus okinawaensis TaxID=465554 RepID=A0A811KRT9_9BILA|nr:unnamed protein product [Bursaphelenchus okinawaensis]CAG9110160.1 unnamed protein product [Bursaphelenchus okinawaensis]